MLLRSLIAVLACGATAFAQTATAPQLANESLLETLPFSMIGKLIFAQGGDWFQGSGTVIRPAAVLTAAHNLWDANRGFSTDLIFERARAGETAAGTSRPSRVYVLGGYRDSTRRGTATDPRAFAQDLGLVLFPQPVASGASAGWWSNPALLLADTATLALGYGAENHDGTHLLSVGTRNAFSAVTSSFFANDTVYFEGGMSGGPLFAPAANGELLVAGVVVAGAEDRQGGGIRALDATAAQFIRAYAR